MARTPIHPGEHLAEELRELGISAAELARPIEVPTNRITGINNGQRAISADTALRLGTGSAPAPNSGSIFRSCTSFAQPSATLALRLRGSRAPHTLWRDVSRTTSGA